MEKKTLPLATGLVFTACILLADGQPAQAYLDPGTGSYAAQIAIAGALGALFSMKAVLRRFVAYVRRSGGDVKEPETGNR